MTSSHPFARAKQGDPQAIAGLLNRSLHPKGIIATVQPIPQGLQIDLQVTQDIHPDPLLRSIEQGLRRLQPEQIQRVQISIYKPSQPTPIWSGSLSLGSDLVEEVQFSPLPARDTDLAPHPILAPGRILKGRYRLERQLSEAVIRKTWLATDLQSTSVGSEAVVIKLLAFGGQMQWADFKLFEREAQILQHLRHDQIPTYRDYFSMEGGQTWFGIVYVYVPGSSLKELVQQKHRLTEEQVLQIAWDVLDILIYLHSLNPPVLHRDIKPSNLIWAENSRTYAVDFGSVQDQAAAEGRTFTVVGTYGYAPMEQFGGRAVPASDLYGLGATLIHLLTGSSPADLPQQQLRIQFADRVSAHPGFVNWISQLVEPAPEDRFATARQALAALRSTLASRAQPVDIALKPTLESNEVAALMIASRHPDQVLSTFATPSLVPQTQPYGSQVEVHSSPSHLHIHIPPERLSSLGIKIGLYSLGTMVPLWLLFGVLGLGAGIGLVPLIGIGSSFVLLRRQLTDTELQFDRHQFWITYAFLGFRHQQQGPTEPIVDVYQDTRFTPGAEAGSQPLGYQITIQVGVQGYSFGRNLSRVECAWLAHTIKQWLRSM